jgi:hypothetical protein
VQNATESVQNGTQSVQNGTQSVQNEAQSVQNEAQCVRIEAQCVRIEAQCVRIEAESVQYLTCLRKEVEDCIDSKSFCTIKVNEQTTIEAFSKRIASIFARFISYLQTTTSYYTFLRVVPGF